MCYSEWETGEFSRIRLTTNDHNDLFLDVRERVMCDWEDETYQDGIRFRFHEWAKSSVYVHVVSHLGPFY